MEGLKNRKGLMEQGGVMEIHAGWQFDEGFTERGESIMSVVRSVSTCDFSI